MKLPSYLRLTKHNIYVFRRRIPQHLIHFFKTTEIRKSLCISSKSLAIINSRQLALHADSLFFTLENNLDVTTLQNNPLITLLKHKKEILHMREKVEILTSHITTMAHSRNALIEQHNREISILSDIVKGKDSTSPKTTKKAILLSEAIELFLANDEVKDRGDKLATVRKNKDSLKLFVEIVGDKPISEVQQSDAKTFKKAVPSYGKKEGDIRSPSTINGYMNSVSKFSNWFAQNYSEYGHNKLEFSALRVKRTSRPADERDKFSIDEVVKLLSHPSMKLEKVKDPAKFWLPHIAAYSAARLEEITQLNPSTDIYKEDGVWVFDINNKDGKALKNLSSIRKIPIHSKLIELGLLEFIERLKLTKANTLFPDERVRDGRTGKNSGKRVNRHIKKILGIDGKTLHSFRHTFATILKNQKVEEKITAAIMGHAHGGITYTRYGKSYVAEVLKPAVEIITFETTH